jgi:hypothetical protein
MPRETMSTEKKLQNIIDLMQRDDSIDAPADSVRWASNLFRTRAAEPKTSIVKKLAAILQMEIAPNKPAFGERSASASQVRQMLFRADENAIDLRIEPVKKGFSLRGQILGEGFENAKVTVSDDTHTFETNASETSEFHFDNVPAGRYELVIRGNGVEISLKAIDIE